MSGESSGGRGRPSLKAGGDIWDYWLGAEEVWSSGTSTLFILSGGPRRSRTDALRLASMRLRLIIQPCFISEFDIFALSLRPLLPCLPLLLLPPSPGVLLSILTSSGSSSSPADQKRRACLQEESFEATLHWCFCDNFGATSLMHLSVINVDSSC